MDQESGRCQQLRRLLLAAPGPPACQLHRSDQGSWRAHSHCSATRELMPVLPAAPLPCRQPRLPAGRRERPPEGRAPARL